MPPSHSKSNKIATNTVLLYIRMVFVTIINLFSVRLVLKALGSEDFGIFNVIVGVVTMFQCLSNVLASATQRFYSINIGLNNEKGLRDIFSTSVNLYILISVIIVIIGETLGVWFVNALLNIPEHRMTAANLIFQFSIISFISSLLSAPYLSSVIANEDIGIFSLINISDTLLKLIAAVITLFVKSDKLIFYSALLSAISLISLIAYMFIARHRYKECHYKKIYDRKLYKQIGSFSGWTLFGSLASVGMNQVNTILINIFFGPTTNAARAVAMQVNSAISSLSASFITAVRPSMISNYASNNHKYLNTIFNISNKFIFYCLLIVLTPIFLRINDVLCWWLGNIDKQTALFVRLIIIYAFILSLNNPISIIIQATGKVKQYHLSVEIFTLACPIITFILFTLNFKAEACFIIMIISVILSHFARLICLKKYYIDFKIQEYLKSFLIPSVFIACLVVFTEFKISTLISNPVINIITLFVSTAIITLLLVYVIGLSNEERKALLSFIKVKHYRHKL